MTETNFSALDSAGASQNIDVFKPTGGSYRQGVVITDAITSANIAVIQATDPSSNSQGIVVRDVNTSAIVSRLGSTIFVSLDSGHTLGSISSIGSSVAVFFDRANPNVLANAGTGSFNVQFDPGHELGSIKGINSSIGVFFDGSNPSVKANAGTGSFTVQFDPGHELGSIKGINNTIAVDNVTATGGQTMDENFKAQRVLIVGSSTNSSLTINTPTSGTFQVFLPDTGHTLGKVDAGAGTFNVAFSPSNPAVNAQFVNIGHTASIFTTSGSASGVSVSGNTIVAPSSSYNFKIFAFALTSTAQVNITVKFTNGSGGSPTEFWRYAMQAPSQGISGANLAVPTPSYLFATGTNTTLALVIDSASLVHYSVSYIKESS